MTRVLTPLRGAATHRGGGEPALVLVAHGSRDPRSAANAAAVRDLVAAARPELAVRLAFLDLTAPSVDRTVDAVAAAGFSRAVVVPLLLGSAFHARVDLPGLLDAARRRLPRLELIQAEVLGPDPHLITALCERIAEASTGRPVTIGGASGSARTCPPATGTGNAGATIEPIRSGAPITASGIARATIEPSKTGTPTTTGIANATVEPTQTGTPTTTTGIAVAAVGSTRPGANERTAEVAAEVARRTGLPTEICFATSEPTMSTAIARLRARGVDRIIVAPWFLAPGLLTDRLLTTAPDVVHAATIGAHSALAEVVSARYDSALAAELELSA
ncbi:sirohydrochlorin chelatase [Nocardia rhizosphaerae]|uniref:Sirohydrochlorin chelatase n=1 Tax=Nocardia rhizosphaerae TaxID=1691571 RepID=A0ABV8LA50_9NOCA